MKGSDRAVKIVGVGGGAAGLGMSARLVRLLKNADHVDRSGGASVLSARFTLIGSGVYRNPNKVWRRQADCIPEGVKWVKQAVTELDPPRTR